MKRKVLIVKGNNISELENLLNKNWEVEHISSFSQNVSNGQGYGITTGNYGAYVILKQKKQELTEDEVRAKLMSLITEDEIRAKLKMYE